MARSLVKRIEAHRNAGLPRLRLWLEAHYDELHPVLNAPRPPWRATAKAAMDEGVRATEDTVRACWLRISKRRDVARVLRQAPSRPLGVAAVHPPARPTPATGDDWWDRMNQRAGRAPKPINEE